MTATNQLLRRYAEEKSEDAFGELVSRYVDLVYSIALRRVAGDTHLAEDVVQTVFADLARKASSLSEDVMLGGWLHRHTCFIAASAVRKERRRQAREQQAIQMNEHDSESDWQHLAPVLDDAIGQLKCDDRTVIVLRYFEQRDLRLVGEALGISEEAARKRVVRAVDKLRGLLMRRGVALSASALGTALGAKSIIAAPVGLSATVAASAIATAATTTGITLTAIYAMTATKIKIGLASVLVAAALTTPIVVQHQALRGLRQENAALRAASQELAPLRAENRLAKANADPDELERLRKEHRELMRLRGEVGLLRKESQELARLRMEQRQPQSEQAQQAGRNSLPAESWANVGNDTPEAALQTFFWAARHKDTDLVSRLIRWRKDDSVPDLEGLEELMRSLVPASSRFVSDLAAITIVAAKEEDANTARMRVEFATEGGKTEPREFQLVKEEGQWMPLFHAWSPHQGSIQAAFDVPLSPDLTPAN